MEKVRMGKRAKFIFFNTIGFVVVSGLMLVCMSICSGEEMKINKQNNNRRSIEQVVSQRWESLAQKNIFFGHQSVGDNIIQGIKDLQEGNPAIHLNIVRTKDKLKFEEPLFAHFEIGKNDYPLTKIQDFVEIMDNGLGAVVDVAFMKFCFVDFKDTTNISKVFTEYKKNVQQLRSRYPNMTIIHFTVPLLRQEHIGIVKKVKSFFAGLTGKKKDRFFSNSHNATRNEYNKLLVDYYGGKEPVFDLALLESIDPTGKREIFSYDGNEYFALAPAYTDDGGHLNKKGRKYIAEQLLVLLADLKLK